jgi:hypothetical protein
MRNDLMQQGRDSDHCALGLEPEAAQGLEMLDRPHRSLRRCRSQKNGTARQIFEVKGPADSLPPADPSRRRLVIGYLLLNEIAAWEEDRNANHAKADWQFTTPEARIRLKHLYPSI